MNLTALWDALTWHTLIEVISIVVAAMIVHPVMGVFRHTYDGIIQSIASSSRTSARKRVKVLFDYYAHIWRKRKIMLEEPYRAALETSTENLGITLTALAAVLIGNAVMIFTLPVGLALLGYAVFRYNKVSTERNDTLRFDDFRDRTIAKITELRTAANDDAQLALWWRSYFDKEPPFWEPRSPAQIY